MAGICSEPIGVLDGDKVPKGGVGSRASDLLAEDEESNGDSEPPEQGEVEEKGVKKPNKLLPCPRCKNLNTKFCYFNNCNPNQPRHFCRSCQRYWTVGGTLRKLPVGSGRRKSAASRHLGMGRSAPTVQVSSQDFYSLSAADIPRSTSLFSYHGKEAPPLGQTTSSIGEVMQHKHWNGGLSNVRAETYASNDRNSLSNDSVETDASNEGPGALPSHVNELVCSCSVVGTQSHSLKDAEACKTTEASKKATTTNTAAAATTIGEPFAAAGFMGSSPFSFPMGPWPYGYGSFGGDGNFASPFGPSCPPSFPSWFPWPLMPMPFGGWGGGPWNIPFLPPWGPPSFGPASPILGKHPREESKKDGGILIPKTLRIQDPKEAAQSSIWSSLGLDNRSDLPDSISAIFKGFPPKADVAESEDLTVHALRANPAAETRSTTFQENSSSVLVYEY